MISDECSYFYLFLINLFQFGTDEAVRTFVVGAGPWSMGY